MGLVSPKISARSLAPVCRQLATAYDAGIPIAQSLDLIKRQTKNRKVRDMFARMGDGIREGGSLADVTKAESRYLPTYVVEVIAAGETGGKLDVMFNDMADYFEDRLEIHRKIVRGLAYPSAVLVAAWYLGTFSIGLINRVMGSFTSGSFELQGYVEDYVAFQAMATVAALVVAGGCILLARAGAMGWIWGLFSTHLWPFSWVTRRFALARFFRSLSFLIASGLPIERCIRRAAAVTGNPFIERDLLKATGPVREGATLTEAFSRSRYLLPTAREMLDVGEQTGKLDTQLRKVSQYYLQQADHAVGIALKLLPVVVILAVGGIVGYTVISFYVRLYGGLLDGI